MKLFCWMSFVASTALLLSTGSASAGVLPFGTTDTFDSLADGSHPGEFHDSMSGWDGDASVSAGELVVTAGPDDSYQAGYRNGPYGHIGSQVGYPPVSGDAFSIFADIYTAAAPGVSGSLWWTNAVNNANDGSYLTETGFAITPGASTWNFTSTAGGNAEINLAADAWYTMEVIFDRSGPNVSAILNLYAQGTRTSGSALFTLTQSPLFLNPSSSDLGGPRYSWFTAWDNDTVDSLRIDNVGTDAALGGSVVPEPATLSLAGIGAFGLLIGRRRRQRALRQSH